MQPLTAAHRHVSGDSFQMKLMPGRHATPLAALLVPLPLHSEVERWQRLLPKCVILARDLQGAVEHAFFESQPSLASGVGYQRRPHRFITSVAVRIS